MPVDALSSYVYNGAEKITGRLFGQQLQQTTGSGACTAMDQGGGEYDFLMLEKNNL